MSMIGITSCGTDIGKTFISAALISHFRSQHVSVHALKPVISGLANTALEHTDSGRLLAAMGKPINLQTLREISPWQFQAALTPSMAARLENKTLDMQEIARWCAQHAAPDTLTLIEGAGGVMAPLTDSHTMRDFFAELGAPLVLVVGCYLGSISHTLTALAALSGQRVLAVVVTDKGDASVGLLPTCAELARFIPASIPIVPVACVANEAVSAPNITPLTALLEAYVPRQIA